MIVFFSQLGYTFLSIFCLDMVSIVSGKPEGFKSEGFNHQLVYKVLYTHVNTVKH